MLNNRSRQPSNRLDSARACLTGSGIDAGEFPDLVGVSPRILSGYYTRADTQSGKWTKAPNVRAPIIPQQWNALD
jgi:hypothetical protein